MVNSLDMSLLRIPLLRVAVPGAGKVLAEIFVNFNDRVFSCLREISYLKTIGVTVSLQLETILKPAADALEVKTVLDSIVQVYNVLRAQLHPVERALFREQFTVISQLLQRGSEDFTWLSHGVQDFVNECNEVVVSGLASRLNTVVDNSAEIQKIVDGWASHPCNGGIFADDITRPLTIKELVEEHGLRTTRYKLMMRESNARIQELLEQTFNAGFVSKVAPAWRNFVERIDGFLLEGLKVAMASGLEQIRIAIDPATSLTHRPKLIVQVDLVARDIVAIPPLRNNSSQLGLTEFVKQWCTTILSTGSLVTHVGLSKTDYPSDPGGDSSQTYVGLSEDPDLLAVAEALLHTTEQSCLKCEQHLEKMEQFRLLFEYDISETFGAFLANDALPALITEAHGGPVRQPKSSSAPSVLFGRMHDLASLGDVPSPEVPTLQEFDGLMAVFKQAHHDVNLVVPSADLAWIRVDLRPARAAMRSWAQRWLHTCGTYALGRLNETIDVAAKFFQQTRGEIIPSSMSESILSASDVLQVPIVFVLGGPGSGKSTQSRMLGEASDFTVISISDLIQDKIASKAGRDVDMEALLASGAVPPHQTMVELVREAIETAVAGGATGCVLDGFPQTVEEASMFELDVCEPESIVWLDVKPEEMMHRLTARATSESRENLPETSADVKSRIERFQTNFQEAGRMYRAAGKLMVIDAMGDPADVFNELQVKVNGVRDRSGASTDPGEEGSSFVDLMNFFHDVTSRYEEIEAKAGPMARTVEVLGRYSIVLDADRTSLYKSIPTNMAELKMKLSAARKEVGPRIAKQAPRIAMEKADFTQRLKSAVFEFRSSGAFERSCTDEQATEIIKQYTEVFRELADQARDLEHLQELTGSKIETFPEVEAAKAELIGLNTVYELKFLVDRTNKDALDECWVTTDLNSLHVALDRQIKSTAELPSAVQGWDCAIGFRQSLTSLYGAIAVVKCLRSETMRTRHWKQVFRVVFRGQDDEVLDAHSIATLSLRKLMVMRLDVHAAAVTSIVEQAERDVSSETALKTFEEFWSSAEFSFIPLFSTSSPWHISRRAPPVDKMKTAALGAVFQEKQADVYLSSPTIGEDDSRFLILGDFDETFETIIDHQMTLQGLLLDKSSSSLVFSREILGLQSKLRNVELFLRTWNELQSLWLKLTPIFAPNVDVNKGTAASAGSAKSKRQSFMDITGRISKQMDFKKAKGAQAGVPIEKCFPQETQLFHKADDTFRSVLMQYRKAPMIVPVCCEPGQLIALQSMIASLETCRRSADLWLAAQRSSYPSFYFLSSTELMSLYARCTQPEHINESIGAVFQDVSYLDLELKNSLWQVKGLCGQNGEIVEFVEPFTLVGAAPSVLQMVIDATKAALQRELESILHDHAESGILSPYEKLQAGKDVIPEQVRSKPVIRSTHRLRASVLMPVAGCAPILGFLVPWSDIQVR